MMRRTRSRHAAYRWVQGALALGGAIAILAVSQLDARVSRAEDAAAPLPPDPAAPPAAAPADASAGQPGGSMPPAGAVDVSSEGDKAAAASRAEANGSNASPGSSGSNLDQYMAGKSSQQFSGKPITLQVRDVEAADVFRLISEASGFNIILSDEVKGKLTLSMTEVPWDQALDVVLHTLHLGVERNSNILRIMTLSGLTAEKQEQLKAMRAAEASAPKITKVFPISYANLQDLQTTLQKFVSTGATSSSGSSASDTSTTPPVVQIDSRTNSLIVRDLPENIERMRKLIEVLDTQTPQVLVEAKVIEATESFSKNIGGSLGIGSALDSSNLFGVSFAGANPTDALIGSPGVFANGTAFGAASAPAGGQPGGTIGVSPSLSFLPGVRRLNALLNLSENEHQVKVIASPRTVVINKEKASIVQGTPVLVPTTSTVAGVGTFQTNTVQQANLNLTVKPTVTNDGGVLMDLIITRDIPFQFSGGSTAIANRSMTTNVLVDSGATLVIGGIYTMTSDHGASGFPVLRKIPILGPLFGTDTDSMDRSELFIFITPRILNTKEAGLAG